MFRVQKSQNFASQSPVAKVEVSLVFAETQISATGVAQMEDVYSERNRFRTFLFAINNME